MSKSNSSRFNKERHKDTTFSAKVFKAFYHKEGRTMKQVALLLKVERSSITQLVNDWKLSGKMQIIKYGICPITESGGVQFLSTYPTKEKND